MDDYEFNEIDLKPVTRLTTDALGPPGQRVFYIQGATDLQTISLIIEKFQLQTLMVGVEQFLVEIRQRYPELEEAPNNFDEPAMRIEPPVEPLFRVSELGLSYDVDSDLVGLIAREVPSTAEEEKGSIVRYWCTRQQIRAVANWGIELVNRGRPPCEQCGQPVDPAGHFCSRKNGHKS